MTDKLPAPRSHSLAPHPDRDLNRLYAKTPAEMAKRRIEFQRQLEAGEFERTRLSFGIPSVDQIVRTLWAGRLATILGRPSNGKTSLMVHLARHKAAQIKAAGAGSKQYVLFVSLEEDGVDISHALTNDPTVLEMMDGAYDRERLTRSSHYSVETPVWIIDYETTELAELDYNDLPALTVQQIYREIQNIESEFGARPAAIFVDYAQILDTEERKWGNQSRVDSIGVALKTLRKIGKLAGCPVVVGVQANRSADARRPVPVPEPGDAYNSDEIYHASDVMLSIWYPHRYPSDVHGGAIDIDGVIYTVDPALFWLQLLKQRKGQGRARWMLNFDPVRQRFSEIERVHWSARDEIGAPA